MLVLTRLANQAVDITDRATGKIIATVKILSVSPRGVVRIGFDADDCIQILRDDIKEIRRSQPLIVEKSA